MLSGEIGELGKGGSYCFGITTLILLLVWLSGSKFSTAVAGFTILSKNRSVSSLSGFGHFIICVFGLFL